MTCFARLPISLTPGIRSRSALLRGNGFPAFAFRRSGSCGCPAPLRLGADPSQAQDQPPGSALSRTSFVASAFCRSAPFRATCFRFALSPQPPLSLRPLPAGPAYHLLRAGSAPADCPSIRSASAERSPVPSRASGCSVPLRGTASAGSGRTPFVLTPPLRPGLRRLAFVPPPAVPSPQAPPERPPARFFPAHPTGLSLYSAAFRCAALRRSAPTSRFRVGRSCVSAPFRSAPGKPGLPHSAPSAACPCVPHAPSGTPATEHDLRSSPMRQGFRAFGRVLLFGAEGFGR